MDKSSKIILGSIWAMFVIAVGLFVASTTYIGAPPTPLSSFSTQPTLSLSAAECRNPSAAKDCLIFYSGGGLRIYSDRGGSQKVLISGDTGNVSISGTLNLAGTPVAFVPTTTPIAGGYTFTGTVNVTGTLIAGAGVFTSSASIAGTPIVPFVTPRPTTTPAIFYGATPAAVKEICKTVTITDTSLVVAFPGITTPQAVGPIAIDNVGIGNVDLVTFDKAAGIVTLYGFRVVAGTPVAVTTPVTVDVCAKGN